MDTRNHGYAGMIADFLAKDGQIICKNPTKRQIRHKEAGRCPAASGADGHHPAVARSGIEVAQRRGGGWVERDGRLG